MIIIIKLIIEDNSTDFIVHGEKKTCFHRGLYSKDDYVDDIDDFYNDDVNIRFCIWTYQDKCLKLEVVHASAIISAMYRNSIQAIFCSFWYTFSLA